MTTFRKPVPDRVKWVPANKCGKGWADVHVLKRLGYGSAAEGAVIASEMWLPAMIRPGIDVRSPLTGFSPHRTGFSPDSIRLYIAGKSKEDLRELYAAARTLMKFRRDDLLLRYAQE